MRIDATFTLNMQLEKVEKFAWDAVHGATSPDFFQAEELEGAVLGTGFELQELVEDRDDVFDTQDKAIIPRSKRLHHWLVSDPEIFANFPGWTSEALLAAYACFLADEAKALARITSKEGDVLLMDDWAFPRTREQVICMCFEYLMGAMEACYYGQLITKQTLNMGEEILAGLTKKHDSERGRKGAVTLHSRPGGAWEKVNQIRAMWASGKYSSKDVCAEQEYAALNWNFSSARRALRGQPDPT